MRILYDGMIYHLQPSGGVNRYFASLISRLPFGVTPYLATFETRKINYPVHPQLKVLTFKRFRPGRLSQRLEKYFFDYIGSRRFDIVHPTYYTVITRGQISEYRSPVVLTVWDMIHEIFPEHDFEGETANIKRKAIEAAQAIICISENTKKDLLEHYSVPEEKISVTHLASDIDASISYGPESVPEAPYFLYVGVRYKYKNFDTLLRAFAKVHSSRVDSMLCVVGKQFDGEERKVLANLRIADAVVHYDAVTDAHLAKLYRRSVAFVYPSRYEGFGLPPLEAMSCGTPVVSSNSSSLPEVIGDAGLFFDPAHSDDLADILLELLHDSAQRERMIAKGLERTKQFSWDKTAAQTLEIYRSVSDA